MTIPVYSIDSGVPVPSGRGDRVPLDSLAVGESILFYKAQRPAVQSNASRLKSRKGKKFTIRIVDKDKCRVWRTE